MTLAIIIVLIIAALIGVAAFTVNRRHEEAERAETETAIGLAADEPAIMKPADRSTAAKPDMPRPATSPDSSDPAHDRTDEGA